ncbi:MAG: RHS repeat-associated core domain-containing protein, partial [Limisphaerales bacterium]
RKLTTANAANETNSETWDAKSELTDLIDGAGHISIRSYDSAGNQIILTNRNANPWHFYFDKANRLTNTVSPLGRSTTVVFNHQGLPVQVTDPMSQITTNAYDAKGRLTNRADRVASTFYAYDANDNCTSIVEKGLTNSWTYDAYNRVSSYTDVYGNLVQYRYDANGNLINLIYPGGRNVYYAYDSNNNMTNVTDWSGRKTTLTYDLDGHMTGVFRPNGTSRIISYDSAGEVTSVLEQMANGLPIALMRYNWDEAGRMSLDFIAPLPHTNSPPPRSMTYDNDNELKTVDGYNVSVDNDGNLLSGPLTNDTFVSYMYDARNRLTNAAGVVNIYDAANNRVGQTYGTNSVEYVISSRGKLPIVLERVKNGVTTYYIYGHGGLLYQIMETPAGTNTLTYHYDYRGSTIALTGDNGLVTDRMEYSVYGTMTYHAGASDTPFLFAGRYNVQSDPNGLLYMQARYYSPYLCRFINPDPTGFKGGMNFYAYANGNPASMIDPFGLDASPIVTANGDNITYQAQSQNTSLADILNDTPPSDYPLFSPNLNQTDTGSSLYETTSTALGVSGITQSGLELSPLDEATIGDNGSIYWSGWGGGSRAQITTYEIAPYIKGAGVTLGVVSVGVDLGGALNGDITWTKFGVNTGVGVTAFAVGGVPGAIIGGGYFVVDQINGEPNGWSDVYNSTLDGLYGSYPEDGGAGDP